MAPPKNSAVNAIAIRAVTKAARFNGFSIRTLAYRYKRTKNGAIINKGIVDVAPGFVQTL